MTKRNILLFFFSFYIIFSCNKHQSQLEIRDYYAEGIADSNHLESGLWKFYGLEKHNLCQEGIFRNGIRVGLWKYYLPYNYSIEWIPFYSKNRMIRTNIPIYLRNDTDEGNFIAFVHNDTSKLLILKIGIAQDTAFDVFTYNKVMLQEVKKNSLRVKSNVYASINTTCNRLYYFNKFSGIDNQKRDYTLLTINSILNEKLLVEITVRCDKNNLNLGEETFFSVMSNLFINENRFFDENINCEIIRNKAVRSNHDFSFGCNRHKQ